MDERNGSDDNFLQKIRTGAMLTPMHNSALPYAKTPGHADASHTTTKHR